MVHILWLPGGVFRYDQQNVGLCRPVGDWFYDAEGGAGCRNRTRDLLITNQLLYQLS